ncbi:hypothetical protein [Novosphingobium sp. BL-52-GroH]|uniref:hypothetical protein n=1 Tax=Novosphingobium sp. BL-52-GroH TaxID=3349877 RepID=UPI00384DF096
MPSRHLVFLALLVATSLYAVIRGGRPERIGAATMLAGSLLSACAVHAPRSRFIHAEGGILLVDLAMLGVITWLAVRSTRFWPIWVAAMILAETVVHIMSALAPRSVPIGYLRAQALWSWISLILLLGGTFRHRWRERTGEPDPPWKA